MSGIDRLSDGYQPRFDHDLEIGRQGELFVASVQDSFADGTVHIETKTDQRVAQTGNVYIEYKQKPSGYLDFKDSGIATTQAALWAFVLPSNVLIVAPTESVRAAARHYYPGHRRECVRGDNPTRGVVIRVGSFVEYLYRYEPPT